MEVFDRLVNFTLVEVYGYKYQRGVFQGEASHLEAPVSIRVRQSLVPLDASSDSCFH